MPDFGKLASDVEPLSRSCHPSPRNRKGAGFSKIEAFDKTGQLHAGERVQIGEDARAESLGHLDPLRVEAVDEFYELSVAWCRSPKLRWAAVTMQRESTERCVRKVSHDVSYTPGGSQGRTVLVLSRQG